MDNHQAEVAAELDRCGLAGSLQKPTTCRPRYYKSLLHVRSSVLVQHRVRPRRRQKTALGRPSPWAIYHDVVSQVVHTGCPVSSRAPLTCAEPTRACRTKSVVAAQRGKYRVSNTLWRSCARLRRAFAMLQLADGRVAMLRFVLVGKWVTRFGLERRGRWEGGVLYQDHRDRIRYPRSLLYANHVRGEKGRHGEAWLFADQLDAYLGLTAPLRHRPVESGTVVQGTLWEDGPIPIRRDHLEGDLRASTKRVRVSFWQTARCRAEVGRAGRQEPRAGPPDRAI